jgi:acyl carrier protein
MNNNNNEEKLKQVMADVFGVPAGSIDDSASIDTIERWDSTGHLNLVLALEEQFNIRFNEEQMAEATNHPAVRKTLESLGVRF